MYSLSKWIILIFFSPFFFVYFCRSKGGQTMNNDQIFEMEIDDMLARFMYKEDEMKVIVRVKTSKEGRIVHCVENLE